MNFLTSNYAKTQGSNIVAQHNSDYTFQGYWWEDLAEPASPAEGDCYLPAETGTASSGWDGITVSAGELIVYSGGVWVVETIEVGAASGDTETTNSIVNTLADSYPVIDLASGGSVYNGKMMSFPHDTVVPAGQYTKNISFILTADEVDVYLVGLDWSSGTTTGLTYNVVAEVALGDLLSGTVSTVVNKKYDVPVLWCVATKEGSAVYVERNTSGSNTMFRTSQTADVQGITVGQDISFTNYITNAGLWCEITTYSEFYDVGSMSSKIDTQEKRNTIIKRKALHTEDFSSGYLQTGFTIGSSATASTANSMLLCQTPYRADKKNTKWVFGIGSSTEIAVGALDDATLTSNWQTYATINFSTGVVNLYDCAGALGQAARPTTVISTITMSQSISTSDIYEIELERYRKITTIRVRNNRTGDLDELEYNHTGVFSTGAGNHRPNYFVELLSGAISVRRHEVYLPYKPKVAIFGDSIDESAGYTDTGTTVVGTVWTEMLDDYLGGTVVNCAESGVGASALEAALDEELLAINPQYLVVKIGTNGGISSARLQTLLSWSSTNGIDTIVCHIPMSDRDPSASNSAPVNNAIIDTELASYPNSIGARFDVATALNNDPDDGYDPSLLGNDGVHPNEAGSIAMFNRFIQDCPFVR